MKCRDTQGFSKNANSSYAGDGLSGHTGRDRTCGYQSNIESLWKDELVYKLLTPANPYNPDGFTGVFTIVELDGELFEFLYGHCSDITVAEGEKMAPGRVFAKESNHGRVFSGGQACSESQKLTGCGSHVHYQKRLVKKVLHTMPGKQYLTHPLKGLYRDDDGYWYEIINYDNGFNGCVNFQFPWEMVEEYGKTIKQLLHAKDKAETDAEADKFIQKIVDKWLAKIIHLLK